MSSSEGGTASGLWFESTATKTLPIDQNDLQAYIPLFFSIPLVVIYLYSLYTQGALELVQIIFFKRAYTDVASIYNLNILYLVIESNVSALFSTVFRSP
jgi:hypothetical protein